MAVTLLEIARIFATKVPGKIDADVLQLLWKVGFRIISSYLLLPLEFKLFCILVLLLLVELRLIMLPMLLHEKNWSQPY